MQGGVPKIKFSYNNQVSPRVPTSPRPRFDIVTPGSGQNVQIKNKKEEIEQIKHQTIRKQVIIGPPSAPDIYP